MTGLTLGAPALAAAPPGVSVAVATSYASLAPGQALRMAATVTGTTVSRVFWKVDGVIGGDATVGRITPWGIYLAPKTPPANGVVSITAVSRADPLATATAMVTLTAGKSTGRLLFVSPSGNDAAAGTIAAPFRTVQHAVDAAGPGDTVLLRAGTYHEIVRIAHSGSAQAGYLTLAAYPGETSTLDGNGLSIPDGQDGLVGIADASFVVIEGLEIRNYRTASAGEVPVGIYVTGGGSHLQILNNHIHDIVTTAATTPSACGSNALGLAVYGTNGTVPLSRLVIGNNEINALHTGCSESVSVNGNVDGFAIVDNRIHDNDNIGIDAIGAEGTSPDPETDAARNGEIRNNSVYNITSYGNPDYGNIYASDGIYVDGGHDIVVEQNLVHHVDLGIELASEHEDHASANIVARNNVVHDDNSAGFSVGGYDAGRGGSDHVSIVNNTLSNNDTKQTGSGEIQIQFHATNLTIANNVVQAGAQGLILHSVSDDTTGLVDDNLYTGSSASSKLTWQWNGSSYSSFAAWRTGTGMDANAPGVADPAFRGPDHPPALDVRYGSPAIRASTVKAAALVGLVDFVGNRRTADNRVTLGAWEH